MSQKTFDVVFSGKLVEGAALEKVKANVAALFKVEVAKVGRLFSGGAVPIKKGVDAATAKKYQMALLKAGAICKVVDRSAATARPVSAAAKPSTRAPSPASTAASSQAAAELQRSVVKAPPKSLGELGAAQIDAPGVTLVEHQEVPPPQIDTSALSVDQVGADLTEHEEVPELQVDLSTFSVGEVGESLGEEQPFVPLEVDTSSMALEEPGADLSAQK